MSVTLTPEIIDSVIAALPIQGRIMLRLLLLQYLDLAPEDIEFIVADRPDPRFVSGAKPLVPVIARETIQGVADRVAQYRTKLRQRREQTWLQIECLRKHIAFGEALCAQAERLLRERFGLDAEAVRTLHAGARAAIPKPAVRELDRQWARDEITEEAYRRRRLEIEYQTELRKLDRERKRLQTALLEHAIASQVSLQDHEIGHIWGIPAGTLAARKAKFLHQYLQGLQAALQLEAGGTGRDLWKETFNVLTGKPVERSTVPYDGLDRTEASLMERLAVFAARMIPEDFESRAWLAISQSLFALQRLSTIQSEQEKDGATLEQALLQRTAPPPKTPAEVPADDATKQPLQLDELGEHVLRSMKGEEPRHLTGLQLLFLTDILAACMT